MTMDFDEYIQQREPNKQERAYTWRTAIGLQAVDGLSTSDYLKETARRHIEGEITIDEARNLIQTYYQSKTNHEPDEEETHWCVPTTRTRKKGLIIRLYIWNDSSEIYCWTIIGTCETVIFISIPQPNGKNNPTLQTGQVQDKYRTSSM